jgi:parallel beta-helix repeat protein
MKNEFDRSNFRVLVIGMFFMLISAMVIIIIPNNTDAVTHTVGKTGDGADFTSIQTAINNAQNGDTIWIYTGTYNENVVINKRLDIIGNGTSNTIVNGTQSGDVMSITANRVNITALTVINSSNTGAGIKVNNADYCIIYDVLSTDNGIGIYLYQSNYNKIGYGVYPVNCTNNTINSIKLYGSYYNNLTNIEIFQVTLNNAVNHSEAVLLDNQNYYNGLENITIKNNFDDTSSNIIYYDGIFLNGSSSSNNNNDIRNCTITNTMNGIHIKGSSTTQNLIERNNIYNNSENGIIIDQAYANVIQFHKPANSKTWGIHDNDRHGIYLNNTEGININNNYIYNNNKNNNIEGDGIYVENASGNSNGNIIEKNGIYNNAVGNQRYGIHFYNTTDAYVRNNNKNYNNTYGIYKNKKDGIFLDNCVDSGSYYDRIQGNWLYENEDNGVHLLDSTYIRIDNNSASEDRNKIYDNKDDGILLEDSDNNTIEDNIIYNTASGTQQHGIHLKKDAGGGICNYNQIKENNSIYHNEEHGIYLEYADDNHIIGSGIYENNQDNSNTGDGIRLEHSDDNNINVISNNSHTGTGYQLDGISLNDSDDNIIDGGDYRNNKNNGFHLNSACDGNTIHSSLINQNEENGIFIEGISGTNPKKNVIGSDNSIQQNSKNGIYLKYCGTQNNENTITTCDIRNNNDYGIKMEYCNYNKIEYNEIYQHDDTGEAGIYLYDSDYNEIKHNDIGATNLGNYDGIYLENSDYNTITGNTIKDNDNYGIYLCSASNNNEIYENTIQDNTDYGINISDTNSNTNEIYHNDFIDNNGGNVQAYDKPGNTWDKGYTDPILDPTEGGNYWNDHDEVNEGVYDDYSGSSQTNPGPDQVADDGQPNGGLNEYNIDGGNAQDTYPFVIQQT